MTAKQNNFDLPERVVPVMPCPDIKTQVTFYRELGFEVTGLYTSPNPYASLRWGSIELHFWGSRKVVASENSTMCILFVRDVDEVHRMFTAALKKFYGRIPRTGFPKITKVRDLADDRRFTLTDPGGNTLFIVVKATEDDRFFRTLDDQKYAKKFAVLYDILYSKEDPELAGSLLPKYSRVGGNLKGLDKAKFLLVVADIQKHLNKQIDDSALSLLIKEHEGSDEHWKRIKRKYLEILKDEE